MVKRIKKSNALKKLNVPKVKKGRPVLKRQDDVKYIPQQKIKEMYNELNNLKLVLIYKQDLYQDKAQQPKYKKLQEGIYQEKIHVMKY